MAKIKINSIKDLKELSSGSSGAVQGHTYHDKNEEELLRMEIRKIIKDQRTERLNEEKMLRGIIRSLIKEAKDVSNPHPNTGINKLRDAFRKARPTIKSQFQQLTTSKDQRDSFIAHLLAAFVRLYNQLDALNAPMDRDWETHHAIY